MKKKKTIKLLTVCGSGIVTSSMLASKLKEMFEDEGYDVTARESNPSELETYISREHYDLVVYASPINVDDLNGTPALPAIGLITGRGEDEFLEKALEIFKAAGK
jgi:galactitol PTS system EIIB component